MKMQFGHINNYLNVKIKIYKWGEKLSTAFSNPRFLRDKISLG